MSAKRFGQLPPSSTHPVSAPEVSLASRAALVTRAIASRAAGTQTGMKLESAGIEPRVERGPGGQFHHLNSNRWNPASTRHPTPTSPVGTRHRFRLPYRFRSPTALCSKITACRRAELAVLKGCRTKVRGEGDTKRQHRAPERRRLGIVLLPVASGVRRHGANSAEDNPAGTLERHRRQRVDGTQASPFLGDIPLPYCRWPRVTHDAVTAAGSIPHSNHSSSSSSTESCCTHVSPFAFIAAALSRCRCSMTCFCFVASPQFFAIRLLVTGSQSLRLSWASCSESGRTSFGINASSSRFSRIFHSCSSALVPMSLELGLVRGDSPSPLSSCT